MALPVPHIRIDGGAWLVDLVEAGDRPTAWQVVAGIHASWVVRHGGRIVASGIASTQRRAYGAALARAHALSSAPLDLPCGVCERRGWLGVEVGLDGVCEVCR